MIFPQQTLAHSCGALVVTRIGASTHFQEMQQRSDTVSPSLLGPVCCSIWPEAHVGSFTSLHLKQSHSLLQDLEILQTSFFDST